MVNQTLDLVTLCQSNCHTDERQTTLVPAVKLQAGQHVLHDGALLKVRRVIPAFTRPQACHVHLVPLNWQLPEGVSPQLADRDEAAVLVRVACPILRLFQVVV